jgi:iron complex transport system substrate-binding protein
MLMLEKKNRIITVLLIVLVLLFPATLWAGGGKEKEAETSTEKPESKETEETTQPSQPETVRITDSSGRVVELPYPVERSIITYSQLLLVIKALGVGDESVNGLDEFTYNQYETIFTGLANTPTVGKNLFNLDIEKVIDLEPQVLISTPSTLRRMPELEAQLEKVGIKFVGLDFDIENVENVIITLGAMFGKEDRAEDFADFWFDKLDLVKSEVDAMSEEEKVKVYWENTASGYVTISKKSSAHEIVTLAGGNNIAQDLEGRSPEVDPEWVITQDPDVIMHYPMGNNYQGGFGTSDTEPFKRIRQEIISRPGFDQIKAVKSDEVYICSQIIKTGAFENIAVIYVAKALYPDLFKDLDPAAELKEMVEKYLGLSWATMDGVFIYPDPLR